MKKLLSFLLVGLFVSSYYFSADASDKKYQRLIMKANRLYENFAYSKAVEVYEKAIELKQEEDDLFDMQSALKIADSYRLMNRPISAEKWYNRVTKDELWTDQDKMNFAQVLLKNGKDVAAKEIVSQIKSPGLADALDLALVDHGANCRICGKDTHGFAESPFR